MKKRYFVLATLVLALGVAVYLNWQLSPGVTADEYLDSRSSDDAIGDARYVNAGTEEDEGDNLSANSSGTDYYAQARVAREASHEEAIESIQEIIDDASLTDTVKASAVQKAAELAEIISNEQKVENLIKAKGFTDCLVAISDEQTTVVVKSESMKANEAAIIKDIVVSQLNVSPSAVKIIESK